MLRRHLLVAAMAAPTAALAQSGHPAPLRPIPPAADTWQSHAPMPTPRHAVAAVAIGDKVYVAGGGAILGGGVQSSVHEAFTLA